MAQEWKDFENLVKAYFKEQKGVDLEQPKNLKVGFKATDGHNYDLGIDDGNVKILVECKANNWRNGSETPSGKMAEWCKDMLFLSLAPSGYERYFVAKKKLNAGSEKTLLAYFCEHYPHLVPDGVRLLELDESMYPTEYTYNAEKKIFEAKN